MLLWCRYHWAKAFNADGTAGPDGGTLPESGSCGFEFNTNRAGGDNSYASWANIPYPGSQPYATSLQPLYCAFNGGKATAACA